MYFVLRPVSVRKRVDINAGAIGRSLTFMTRLELSSDSDFDPSTLQDGRPISSLDCSVRIGVKDRLDGGGLLGFVPAATDGDLRIQWGDCLDLDIDIPEEAFEIFWKLADVGRSVVCGARVCGLASKYPYSPRSAPYIWDISNKKEFTKEIEGFWFAEKVKLDSEGRSRSSDAWSPSDVADVFHREVQSDFGRHTQMYRICVSALQQAEKEALRQELSFEETRKLLEHAVGLVRRAQSALRKPSREPQGKAVGELWYHREFDRDHIEGLRALADFEIDNDAVSEIARDLIDMPWLKIDELEWAIVDALIFNAAFRAGEDTKVGEGSIIQGLVYDLSKGDVLKMGWRMTTLSAAWTLVRCCLGVGILLFIATYVERHIFDNIFYLVFMIIIGLFALWFIAGCPFLRRRTGEIRAERHRLFLSMRVAYLSLEARGHLLCPNQLMNSLLVAQSKGAIWPPVAFALISRASLRSTSEWRI